MLVAQTSFGGVESLRKKSHGKAFFCKILIIQKEIIQKEIIQEEIIQK
jgi:hypothetical protein